MNNFKKITEDFYYDEDTGDIEKYLCDRVSMLLQGNEVDNQICLEQSLIECESPIEQMLSIEFEEINLLGMINFNPFIDIVAIDKQVEIECQNKKYRVDFLIPVIYKNQENKYFVVECDGHEFHQKTKKQVENDNIRMRNLQKSGYEVIRFSGTEIWHNPYKCACEVKNIIMSYCKYQKGGN